MLNPPLSILPDDLLLYIVDHVAELPSPHELCNLSLADRSFTRSCQAHVFKVLYFGYEGRTKRGISNHLEKTRRILDDMPSITDSVRDVHLTIPYYENARLFNHPTFVSIFQLLAKSSRPPHKFYLSNPNTFLLCHPMFIVGRLMKTFFSQTITVLHLTRCNSFPLSFLLICPRLKEILLEDVIAREESHDKYQCFDRELPTLDSLDYCKSATLVKQMITPPFKLHTSVVLWSQLRVLTLCPHEKEEMACLQPILDHACNTLQELYLTKSRMPSRMSTMHCNQLPLTRLVNLRNLSCLHVFALYAIIQSDKKNFAVLYDINDVLSTIPTSNKVTSLTFHFGFTGQHPYRSCLEEHWVGLCDQVIRISGGRHLKLNLNVSLSVFDGSPHELREKELCKRINKKIISLSEHPSIRTQFDNNVPISCH